MIKLRFPGHSSNRHQKQSMYDHQAMEYHDELANSFARNHMQEHGIDRSTFPPKEELKGT